MKLKIIRKILDRIRGGELPTEALVKRGLKIGKNFNRMESSIIDPSHCWHIEIGDDVTLGHYSQLIAHDASTKVFLDHTRVANIKIGNRVFIGAFSLILPGVTIGDDVVIGSGSVVTKDIPSNSLAVGSPAKVIRTLDNYITKVKNKMDVNTCFDDSYTLRNSEFSIHHKKELYEAAKKYGEIYVK